MKRSTKIIALVLALVMVFLLIPITTVSAANIPGGTVLYLVPNANWNTDGARFAAYFFGDGEAWVSMTKVAGESNLYEVTSPAGKNFTNVIFCRMNPNASANNWNNKWNQTSDLVYNGTSNCYTVKEGTWDKGGGTWSTYGSTCAHANVGAAATCTTAQLCLDCGDPVASALGHSYNSSHLCTRCDSQAVFTVAGSGAHLGTEWDTGNTANDMTYADGVYTKVYTNVAAGSYLLKVARDHDWGTAYPSADKAYTVATSGSTVTVTLKGTTVTVTVDAPHTHSWSDATCTEAAKCACGETQGDVNPDAHKMVDGVCENGCGLDLRVTTAEELVAALANGGDVYLGADITISAKLDVVADTVIHGNDYTLTYTANGGRVIDVAVGTNGANLTVNDLKIVCTSSWVERGINYNTSGTLTLNNVTIEAVAVNYAINLPSSSDNCTVVINDSHITGFIALNVWGENSNITINNSELYTQNNDTESGSCISVNFSTDAAANYTTVTVNGGKLISYFKNGELSNVVRNYATGSTVTISEETVVEGKIIDEHIVAMVAYPPYSDFYAYTSLQSAVNKCLSNHAEGTTNAKVVLLMDVALDELETPCNFEIDLNGYTLTVTNWTKTHNFVAGEVVAPTIDAQGYTVYTCSDCSATENRDFVDALTPVATADGDPYATLADALENGSEIVLLRDIELDAPIVVAKGASYTIDLNGYTLSYTSTNMGEAMITNKGTLVINDSVGTGVINYNYVGANDASYGKGNYTISNGGTLTVNGGKITIANLRQHAKYPIDNNSTTGDAILVINGGHLYNYNTSAIRMFCNSTTYKNSVTINGGLVEGYSAIWMQNPGKNTVHGSLTITGGEIRTTAAAYVNGTATLKEVSSSLYTTIDGEGGAWTEDSLVAITGGTLNENVNVYYDAPANVTIGEATFNGNVWFVCEHEWVDADCDTPKTCSVCGETEGEALGHTWVDADCDTPKTCSVCGETEGEALGHTWVDATCTAPKTCSVCSATEGDVLDHTYVDGSCSSCGAAEPHTHKDTGLDAKCDECGEYFVPASPFKLEMYQHSKGGTYYFKGSMSGYYFATTSMNSLTGAVDVYAEETEGGYYLYFLSGTTKNYLYVQISGNYTNIKYGSTKAVWAFNTTFGTFTTVVNGTTYYMGTYSSYVTISASKFSYVTTSNVDVSQFVVRPVSLADHVCSDFTSKVTNPTCTAQGYTTKTCTACHVATKVDYVDALGHDLVDVEGLAPTCTATGYTAYKDCSRCTYVEGKETLEKVAHTYENCVCTGCDAVLPTLAVTDSFDFTTAEGLEAALASGKLGYTGTFRDNGDSHQFAADSSIQFVVPANTTVTITGHSTGYGVFSVYVNGEKNDMAGALSFTVTEETKVVIVPDETATYSKAYLKGIALAEYVDRTITSDTTVTFGSEGNYKDSIVDFSGIQIGDNGGNNSQVKNGSFDLLLKAGSKVVIHGYPGYTSYQLNGGEEITDEYYTYLALEDTTLTVTPVSGNNYFYSIEVTLHTGVTLVEAKDATCTEAGHGAHYVCDCHSEPLTDKGEVAALGHTFVYGKCSVCGAADPDYVPYVNTLVVGDTNKIVVDGDTFNDYNLPIEWVAFVADEKAEYTFVGNNGALVFIFDAELNLLCGGTGKATLEAGTYLICIGNGVVGELNVAVTKTLLEVPHEHVFSDATCTEPSKCECGETQVDALGHSYAFGECTRCGAVDPDYVAPQPPVEDPAEEPSIFQAIIDFFMMIIDFFKNLFKF